METDNLLKADRKFGNESIEGANILLVDDNDINRTITASILTEWGVNVQEAVDGEQAIEIFKESKSGSIDMILMDIMMPQMDGFEATKIIRGLDRPDAMPIPIIAMTGNTFEEDIRKSSDVGMNGHLSKPVKPSVLRSTILKYI